MEKRIGTAIILVTDTGSVSELNQIIHDHSSLVLGRQGLPMRDKGMNIISLLLGGTTDEIGSLTGKLGRLSGISVKSVLLRESWQEI
jgi:putative iron-only hydrogenase system regulator